MIALTWDFLFKSFLPIDVLSLFFFDAGNCFFEADELLNLMMTRSGTVSLKQTGIF